MSCRLELCQHCNQVSYFWEDEICGNCMELKMPDYADTADEQVDFYCRELGIEVDCCPVPERGQRCEGCEV